LMLRDANLQAYAKDNLQIIKHSGEHLLYLINNILDMSKIEAGRIELHPTAFNLPTFLENIANMFRLRAESKALRFDVSLHGESVQYVVADQGMLRQILINLLGNAIKFTEVGSIKLNLTLDQRSADRLWLSASVEDTGAGITDEEREKLFQPFTQAKTSLNTREGTGLGLAISREYARLMGGDVTVSSRPGSGSIFELALPIERGSAQVAVRQTYAHRIIGIKASEKAPKILVADDQFENRDWLVKLLGVLGFSAQSVNDGEAAVRRWEQWNPQLILMDVHMPVMDGLQATRIIKADPRGRETVIVALTASAIDSERLAALRSGIDDFIAKPCDERELFEKIRAHLHIEYDYEQIGDNDNRPSDGMSALSAEWLGQLPHELLEELRNATLMGNKNLMNKVVCGIREKGHAYSADALQELIDRYEYDCLAQLLGEVCRR
jgi:CheY-like chemotaxis protein